MSISTLISTPYQTYQIILSKKGIQEINEITKNSLPNKNDLTPTQDKHLKPLTKFLTLFDQAQTTTDKIKRNQLLTQSELLKPKIPLDLQGTNFQKQVWQEIFKIPLHKTITYGQLAKNIKNLKAVQAVGTACGKNPLAPLIPCHRVLAANNKIGGFASGTKNKYKLLKSEEVFPIH